MGIVNSCVFGSGGSDSVIKTPFFDVEVVEGKDLFESKGLMVEVSARGSTSYSYAYTIPAIGVGGTDALFKVGLYRHDDTALKNVFSDGDTFTIKITANFNSDTSYGNGRIRLGNTSTNGYNLGTGITEGTEYFIVITATVASGNISWSEVVKDSNDNVLKTFSLTPIRIKGNSLPSNFCLYSAEKSS